jgi:hypothetical protein
VRTMAGHQTPISVPPPAQWRGGPDGSREPRQNCSSHLMGVHPPPSGGHAGSQPFPAGHADAHRASGQRHPLAHRAGHQLVRDAVPRDIERENRELRRANETVKTASAFLAAELDGQQR